MRGYVQCNKLHIITRVHLEDMSIMTSLAAGSFSAFENVDTFEE